MNHLGAAQNLAFESWDRIFALVDELEAIRKKGCALPSDDRGRLLAAQIGALLGVAQVAKENLLAQLDPVQAQTMDDMLDQIRDSFADMAEERLTPPPSPLVLLS